MSTAKNIQAKVFGGQDTSPDGTRSPTPVVSPPSDAPPLSIHIPRPPPLQLPKQKPIQDSPPSLRQKSTNGNGASKQTTTLRDRLLKELGTRYDGVERHRLEQDEKKEHHWKRWGPYLSERQWATVREDYSSNGDAWSHFPHSQARSRAYRWGEDGIAGISDNHLRLCFSLAFWNGVDPILKERLFGVTGHQGNHGEDVKELYYYLDSTPTHSYMKYLYKYPQRAYPYDQLVNENVSRSRDVSEYEIMDTGLFDDNRYWDIFVEYAKEEENPDSIYIRVTAYNRGPDAATLHILPQLWFPNTWSWPLPRPEKPLLTGHNENAITASHPTLGKTHLYCLPSPPPIGPDDEAEVEESEEDDSVYPVLLFTENETNYQRLYGGSNENKYAKDAFHDHVVPSHRPKGEGDGFPGKIHTRTHFADGEEDEEQGPHTPFPTEQVFVNPEKKGTKSAAHYIFENVPGNGGCAVVRLKLTPNKPNKDESLADEGLFDDSIEERREEANEFYHILAGSGITDDFKQIMRQALGGMLWTKQFYQFDQKTWMEGDPAQPPPPPERKWIRNRDWRHMHVADILSMPDKWEYPFFAAWDTAFHCIPLAMVDPAFAKQQLKLLVREWYMKPDGQIPAYEWNFGDVNPPVHAWYIFSLNFVREKSSHSSNQGYLPNFQDRAQVIRKGRCICQIHLLSRVDRWVNRKDAGGLNVFEGGFLGLDNIGAFNRSEPLPTGGTLRQADGTAWMAFYCLNMLNIALELAKHNPVYEDIASKFFEHFIVIADAMTYKGMNDEDLSLWNEQDGFYYDAISFSPSNSMQLPVKSLVGLIPLYATLTLEPSVINKLPGFKKRMEWFIENRPEVAQRNMANMKLGGKGDRRLLALTSKERLVRILEKMLDEDEFLSDYGVRSPWGMDVNGQRYELATNFLLIESLQRYYQYYGDELQVECPTGSGDYMNLVAVAEEVQHRIIHIFGRDIEGRRATNGGNVKLDNDPHFRDYLQFYEFFHADDGRGLGASHQTGWTGLVAYHIMQSGVTCRLPKTPRTPRSLAKHYFDENIGSRSEYGDDSAMPQTPYSAFGDTSPDAL
ncbi:Six-hairpin glycosidase-like protein [Phellopilus nigrolimitatus]|nr:Six-hairpin glycosidase-like protein [Phellopilus nigrolimitatus]